MRGSPTWLALVGYRLEFGADVLTLRRSDSSFLAAFSARGTTLEIVLQAAEDDRQGCPIYCGLHAHAESMRRMVRAQIERSWEKFLKTERRLQEARKNGQIAKALAWRLPGEPQEELDQIAKLPRRIGGGLRRGSWSGKDDATSYADSPSMDTLQEEVMRSSFD